MAMAPHTPRPTFKRPDLSIVLHRRPSSPVAPVWEPLSPLLPVEPTFNYPFVGATPSQQQNIVTDGPDETQKQTRPSTTSSRKSSAQSRKHHRTPSTIDDLADAALSNTPSVYPHPSSQPQQPRKASSISHQPHYTVPQYPMPPAHNSPPGHSHGEPVAKRARSEVGPSPHQYAFSARPSTSHISANALGFAYNVEQGIDRARRQSTNTATSIPSEDAELLLNFASRVHPRPAKIPSPVHESLHRAPPALAPSVLPPTSLPPTPAAPAAEPVQGTREDPSASLPSPQDTSTNEEYKISEPRKPAIQASMAASTADSGSGSGSEPPREALPTASVMDHEEAHSTRVPQQTRTPPEDEPNDRTAADAASATRDPQLKPEPEAEQTHYETTELRHPSQVDSPSTVDTAGETDSTKSRPRRGWPKGKPRGPRNKSLGTTKPRSTARRSRASVNAKSNTETSSMTSGDDTVLVPTVRRKSDADLNAFFVSDMEKALPRSSSVPASIRLEILPSRTKSAAGRRVSTKKVLVADDTICSGCSQTRESSHGELDQWIGCNGCKCWFHYDCAGFKNERDVRDVDKFFCKPCEPKHGATTFVRKSTRTHTNVDYAGLNQGILKTSDEDPEHHYIQPIKDATFTFDPETFPRMRPELVTAEYFETCSSFNEPVLIPAAWNPKRQPDLRPIVNDDDDIEMPNADESAAAEPFQDAEEEAIMTTEMEYETAFDDGQDKLGMVIPQGLTVRHVANIVGPDEPLEVIDVKTQGTEGKWNLAKFADYYEADGEKPVRNVISLEVSHTKLGKLLQRPKVVRQIDLQDSVWPAEESAKGNYPKVQFYCLMSVADSFTDFHIDFGGSSVYYHILRGRKTFFFIPPKPSHLKAYEDWNNSPEQNFTWLPTKTKECYRVDLYEGDTMLIPSGWIHAVWTPTNSLVIGGNFLTRLHYSTQFRIVDIEKANKTPLKFRYPQFQKVMWYTVIKYLETDPLPSGVAQAFYQGAQFMREQPIWQDFSDHVGESGRTPGTPDYNARYYSQAELNGLPELINFIFRTVMISLGRIEGVSEDTRKKVVRSIPKSHGDPLDVAKAFALWVAWKRGNEDPPAWAHPEADLPDKEAAEPKKLSARALKQLQRQEAINAFKLAPDRHSVRQQASREAMSLAASSPAPSVQHASAELPMSSSQFTSTPKTSVLGPKRVACDACRKRRIRCKHKEQVTTTTPGPTSVLPAADASFSGVHSSGMNSEQLSQPPEPHQFIDYMDEAPEMPKLEFPQPMGVAPMASMMAADTAGPAVVTGNTLLADPNSKRGRSKACLDCRKSKRRCVHDENGKIDPVKAEQTPVPRGSAAKKRKISGSFDSPSAQKSNHSFTPQSELGVAVQTAPTMPYPMGNGYQQNAPSTPQFEQHQPYPEQPLPQPQWQPPASMYPDPMDPGAFTVNNGPYHQQPDTHYSQQSLEQLANDVLDSRYVNNDEDGGYTVPQQQGSHTAASGAVQPVTQQSQQVSAHLLPQSHHSSDSGVALPDSQYMMGGPVQEAKRTPAPANSDRLMKQNERATNGVTHMHPDLAGGLPNTESHREKLRTHPCSTTTSEENTHSEVIDKAQKIGQSMNSSATLAGESVPTDAVSAAVALRSAIAETSPQASKASLSVIPLYQPPPSASNRRFSKASQPPETFTMLEFTPPQQQNRRRDSSVRKTPAPMGPPESETTASAKKRKRTSSLATPGLKKMKVDMSEHEHAIIEEKSTDELQNDESVKLARELQDQEWGFRRRSREA